MIVMLTASLFVSSIVCWTTGMAAYMKICQGICDRLQDIMRYDEQVILCYRINPFSIHMWNTSGLQAGRAREDHQSDQRNVRGNDWL